MKRLLLLAVLGCLGCSASGPQESILIYGRGTDSVTLDPADASDGESVKALANLFDTLVTYADDSTDIVPSLATSWTESEDRLTWTFELRPDVRFHDGTEFNADAVVYTFDRLRDPNNPARHGATLPYRPFFADIESVEADGPLRVHFRLKHPSSVFLKNVALFSAGIVSPTAMEKLGRDFRSHPVGTGPFRFEEQAAREKLVLAAFDDHWRGPPKVDRVIFKPIPDVEARLRQLETGEIHMADELSPIALQRIRENPNLRALSTPGLMTAYIAMNNDRPPFDNPLVRRAIAHAVDKQAILQSAYDGDGVIANTLVPKILWGSHPDIEDYPFDPSRARELLAEAGVDPKRTEIAFWFMTNGRPYMPQPEKVAAIVIEQLKQLGFKVRTESPPWQAYQEMIGQGEHQICLLGWTTDNADPDNFLYALLDKESAVPPKANNVCFYKSEAVHELLIAAQREGDPARREALYLQAQEIIHEDCPMVPLLHRDLSVGMRPEVEGYLLHPAALVRLRNVSIGSRTAQP